MQGPMGRGREGNGLKGIKKLGEKETDFRKTGKIN